MVKRRALAAGFSVSTCNHTFRATGITTYLKNVEEWWTGRGRSADCR
jgi:hypothetical protein